MEAQDVSYPILNSIQMIESEIEELTQKQEDLCDKGQVIYLIAQKISQKMDELNSLKNYLEKKRRQA